MFCDKAYDLIFNKVAFGYGAIRVVEFKNMGTLLIKKRLSHSSFF